MQELPTLPLEDLKKVLKVNYLAQKKKTPLFFLDENGSDLRMDRIFLMFLLH